MRATAALSKSLVDQYCVTCHNTRLKTGNLMLDSVSLDVAANGAVGEKVVRKLRGGTMPPPGARRPDGAEVRTFVASLETALDRAADALSR